MPQIPHLRRRATLGSNVSCPNIRIEGRGRGRWGKLGGHQALGRTPTILLLGRVLYAPSWWRNPCRPLASGASKTLQHGARRIPRTHSVTKPGSSKYFHVSARQTPRRNRKTQSETLGSHGGGFPTFEFLQVPSRLTSSRAMRFMQRSTSCLRRAYQDISRISSCRRGRANLPKCCDVYSRYLVEGRQAGRQAGN